MHRRQFLTKGLRWSAATAGSILLPASLTATPAQAANLGLDLSKGTRVLDLYRPESGEKLQLEYMRNGVWQGDAYNQLCWLLRDIHVDKHVAMDYTLIGILDWTQWYLRQYGYTKSLFILSGYRTDKTNGNIEGAAKASQHLLGKAIDLTIPGVPVDYLGKLFGWLSRGGVGVYPNRKFVHVDTGSVRKWVG